MVSWINFSVLLLLSSVLPNCCCYSSSSSYSYTETECPSSGSPGLALPWKGNGVYAILLGGTVSSSPSLSVNPSASSPFSLFSVGTAFSYSFWLNPLPIAVSIPRMFILGMQNNQASGNPLNCNNDILDLLVNGGFPQIGQCNVQDIKYNVTVTANVWQHLAFTYDGQGNFSFYLNGTTAGVIQGGIITPSFRGAISQVYLNPYYQNEQQQPIGSLSTLRVYSTSLTPCQVQSDFHGLRQNGLVAEYLSTIAAGPGGQQLPDAINQQSQFSCNANNGCSAQFSVYSSSASLGRPIPWQNNGVYVYAVTALIAISTLCWSHYVL